MKNAPSRSTSAPNGGANRPRAYSKASPPGTLFKDKMKNAPSRSTPDRKSIDLVANILFAWLRASLLAHPASAKVVRFQRLSASNPQEEGGRKTTADVLEGFAPGGGSQVFLLALRLGSSTLACSLKGEKENAPSRSTPEKNGAQNDRGCTRRLRPEGACARGGYHFLPLSPFSCISLIFVSLVCEFGVGDGGGYYMGPVQLILSFSCFCGRFREFRVMIFTPEESLTRNRNTPA